MHKELYFPTPVYFRDIDDAAELNAALLRDILAWRAESPQGIQRSNVARVGAWHSTADMHRRPEYAKLAAQVLDCMDHVFNMEAAESAGAGLERSG